MRMKVLERQILQDCENRYVTPSVQDKIKVKLHFIKPKGRVSRLITFFCSTSIGLSTVGVIMLIVGMSALGICGTNIETTGLESAETGVLAVAAFAVSGIALMLSIPCWVMFQRYRKVKQ